MVVMVLGRRYYRYPDHWVVVRRARKRYVCDDCGRAIEAGDLYIERVFACTHNQYLRERLCLDHLAPDVERIVDRKGKVLWERG